MTRVVVVGAAGFVGSAFARNLAAQPAVTLVPVTLDNYATLRGIEADIVIDASGNSVKYLADQDPLTDVERSVVQRIRTLVDFRASLHVHVSSVDVYHDLSSPATTSESSTIDVARQSRYGFHKYVAELGVRHYARHWLIVRLAGMVGPGLRKNPVYDVLHSRPLRIHPDSGYQYLHTDTAARIVWNLACEYSDQVVNVCGVGLVSPRDVATMANRTMDLSLIDSTAEPRIVAVDNAWLRSRTTLPTSQSEVEAYLSQTVARSP